MRPEESAYWDSIAIQAKASTLKDNIWKRAEIVSRILSHRPIGFRILEIGSGQAVAAATVNLVTLGHMKYTGTDVSAEFCKFVETRWRLKMVQTDILELPEGPFDMIWAFDTLEHVRPEERAAGYAEMDRALGERGMILLNIPLDDSEHDKQFDWGMKPQEVFAIAEGTHTIVQKFEPYDVPEIECSYVWAELRRP